MRPFVRLPAISVSGRKWAIRPGIAVVANGPAVTFRNVWYLTLSKD